MRGCRPVIVKLCGITRQEDATAAINAGVELLGFIFHPGSPRYIAPEQAAAIKTQEAMRVGVFVKQSLDEIKDIMERARLHVAQLHGDQNLKFCKALGRPKIMRVFWPQRYETREELEADLEIFADDCRFFLLDAGLSGGGHGKTIDFSFLSDLKSRRPWFLAGGLGSENLPLALQQCQPSGVDINSAVEASPGVKDHKLLEQALRIIRVDPVRPKAC